MTRTLSEVSSGIIGSLSPAGEGQSSTGMQRGETGSGTRTPGRALQAATEESLALTMPCMPDLVRQLVLRVKAKGYARLTIGPQTRTACQDYLRQLGPSMRPAPREKIHARIVTLMAHYWTPQMPEKMWEAIGFDWAEVLKDMPWPAIEKAAVEWLKTKDRRPTPAQFRKMAEASIEEATDAEAIVRRVLKADWESMGSA